MELRPAILPILLVTGCASSVSAPPPPPAPDFEDAGDCAATLEEQALPPEACLFIPTESVGDCGESLGWGFDGRRCREVTGCAAESDHDLFPTATDCALTCAGVGWCSDDPVFPRNIGFEPQVVALWSCFRFEIEDEFPDLASRYSGCSDASFEERYPGFGTFFRCGVPNPGRCWLGDFDSGHPDDCITACAGTLLGGFLHPFLSRIDP